MVKQNLQHKIRIVITAIIICISSICFSQVELNGEYRLNKDRSNSFCSIIFLEENNFEYKKLIPNAKAVFKTGKYKIENDSLILIFNEESIQNPIANFDIRTYKSLSEKTVIFANVFDNDSLPIEGANVFYIDELKKKNHMGEMADKNGFVKLELHNVENPFKLYITYIAYYEQTFYLKPSHLHFINVYLSKQEHKTSGKEENKQVYQIIETRRNNTLKIKNENGSIETWYKL